MCYNYAIPNEVTMTQVTSIAPTTDRAPIRGATVTMEDGGRLNAFCHRAPHGSGGT